MSQLKALVIDDDTALLETFKIVLEMDDFEVTTVSDSRQAMDEIRRIQPDIITLDMHMPHVSGLQILDKVRADDTLKDIKIIMITAAGHVGDYESVAERVDLVLMKPVTLQQVRHLIGRVIKKSKSEVS